MQEVEMAEHKVKNGRRKVKIFQIAIPCYPHGGRGDLDHFNGVKEISEKVERFAATEKTIDIEDVAFEVVKNVMTAKVFYRRRYTAK